MRRLLLLSLLGLPVQGLTIKVDYRLDTYGFFDNPQARVAMEAAAARWSRIIDQTLDPVSIQDTERDDRRFRLFHPATGKNYVFSSAASARTDLLVGLGVAPPADEYLGDFTLEKDEWILFVGARPMNAIGAGGPLVGAGNPQSLYLDPNFFLNRGFNIGTRSLNVLGGFIAFKLNTVWSFDLINPGSTVGLDFYSIALHEIGHGLGLNADGVSEWTDLVSEGGFEGENALRAYNEDNGTSLTELRIHSEGSDDFHWENGTHSSKIFPFGSPNYNGTVGKGKLQELLMEPRIQITGAISRAEITNVDIGGLKDIGWSVISQDPPRPPELPLNFTRLETGGLALSFQSEEKVTYIVQTSMNGAGWQNVTPFLIGNGSTLHWEDGQEGFTDPYGPAADLDGKFYRIIKKSADDAEAAGPGQ